MLNVLVTGSSRGLGLELVRQLAAHTNLDGGSVIATARKCSSELQEVISLANGSVVFVTLDVTDKEIIGQSVDKVKLALAGQGLDILINCAGVYGETHGKLALMYKILTSFYLSFLVIRANECFIRSDLEHQLLANATGAHYVLQNYLPLMQTSKIKKVISM